MKPLMHWRAYHRRFWKFAITISIDRLVVFTKKWMLFITWVDDYPLIKRGRPNWREIEVRLFNYKTGEWSFLLI